jgi:hypothetical protein
LILLYQRRRRDDIKLLDDVFMHERRTEEMVQQPVWSRCMMSHFLKTNLEPRQGLSAWLLFVVLGCLHVRL